MANSMLRGFPGMAGRPVRQNPMQVLQNVRRQYQQLRQNPSGVADFLKESGQITDEQYREISGMGGDMARIGQYLLQSAPRNSYGQIQSTVQGVQKSI